MPELGRYAFSVLGSYGATMVIMALLIALTLWRGAQSKAKLAALEAKHKRQKNG